MSGHRRNMIPDISKTQYVCRMRISLANRTYCRIKARRSWYTAGVGTGANRQRKNWQIWDMKVISAFWQLVKWLFTAMTLLCSQRAGFCILPSKRDKDMMYIFCGEILQYLVVFYKI